METDKEFDEFVRRQVAAKEEEPNFDPVKELNYWLNSLDEFYQRIASFLATYIASGQVQLEFRDIDLNEDFSGPYKAKQMMLRFGRQEVTLTPIGTMLIGSKGRIDVRGPAGAAQLVLVDKNATSARSLISVTVEIWRQTHPETKRLIGELRGAFKFRHWLAHGRYWLPRLGRKYDYTSVYALADAVMTSFPFHAE